tara:strand:- start:164 stop:379 length:216 start_codon:yes stop_codon:yes gene_type:complete
MIKEIAKKLLPLVNVKRNVDALDAYVEYRTHEMYKLMEQAEDTKTMFMAQGAIHELRRINTLREEAQAKAE